jgi:hypothetical protein
MASTAPLKVLTRDMLYITCQDTVQSGANFSITIQARDSAGRVVSDYDNIAVLVEFRDENGVLLSGWGTRTLSSGAVTSDFMITFGEISGPIAVTAASLSSMGTVRVLPAMGHHIPSARRELGISEIPVWPDYMFLGIDPLTGGASTPTSALLNALDAVQAADPEEYVPSENMVPGSIHSVVEAIFFSPAVGDGRVYAMNKIGVWSFPIPQAQLAGDDPLVIEGLARGYKKAGSYGGSPLYEYPWGGVDALDQGDWTLYVSVIPPVTYQELTGGVASESFTIPTYDPVFGNNSFWQEVPMSAIRSLASGATSTTVFMWLVHETGMPATDKTVSEGYPCSIMCGSSVQIGSAQIGEFYG